MAERDNPLVQLISVRFKEYTREPEALFWSFGFPILLAIGLGIAFHVSPLMVLQTAFDFDLDTLDIRPGWLVLAAGLCVVALDIVRAWWRGPVSKRQRPPPMGRERAKPVPASNF